jgi:DNA-binding response OmpR family regulator
MSKPLVMLVDDDLELADLIAQLIEPLGFEVFHVATLSLARQSLHARHDFSVIVLDMMLPDGNGLDLCRELRSKGTHTPVLMLSARGGTIDRVLGLEIGADDYLPKPFDGAELVARLRALTRRGQSIANESFSQIGSLVIDHLARVIRVGSKSLELTSAEYKLLRVFAQTPGRPLSRDVLSRSIQPGSYLPTDRSVDVQVARLRKKLREADPGHEWVTTVRGEGYVLTLPAAPRSPTGY